MIQSVERDKIRKLLSKRRRTWEYFHFVIRIGERQKKNEDTLDVLYRIDLEDTLYELKCALIEEDLESAEELEEELLDMLEG